MEEYQGTNATLILTDKDVTIRRSTKVLGRWVGRRLGNTTFRYDKIAATQIIRSPKFWFLGSLQIVPIGGADLPAIYLRGKVDNYTVSFAGKANRPLLRPGN